VIRPLRTLFPLVVALACLVVPALASANVAPNPGFEASCGAPLTPCDWTMVAASSFTLTGLSAHSGSAGADLVSTVPAHSPAVVSSCAGGVTPGTTYNYSAWYRTQALITSLGFSASYASGANCSNQLGNPGGASASSPVKDGLWHEITGQAIAPAGATAASFLLEFTCSGLCLVGTAVSFDDVSLEVASPTAATIRSFTASRSHAGTLVRWRTASEIEVAGFNVYRVEHGHRVKVNRHLIAAKARGGAAYRLLDRAHRGAEYRLEVVNLDGAHQWRSTR